MSVPTDDTSGQDFKSGCSGCLKNLDYYFVDCSEKSSIHGIKFLGERKRSTLEKIWWLIFLLLSFYCCTTLIRNTYQKWERSPVIVSFSRTETEVTKIPFPAVTVCPCIRTAKNNSFSKFYEMVKNQTFDEQAFARYNYMMMICPHYRRSSVNKEPEVPMDGRALKFLMKVQYLYNLDKFSHSFMGGWYYDRIFQHPFKPTLTSEGVCQTFNMLDRDEIFTEEMDVDHYANFSIPHEKPSQWSLEEGYIDDAIGGVYPRKAPGLGEDGGLTVNLRAYYEDMDNICMGGLEGFKVILHHPEQTPNFNLGSFRIGVNQVVSVSVKPNMITTSEQLVNYDPQHRKCFFASERKLKFFKTYNQQDCMLECLANFTYQYCECVEFFMPRTNSTRICGPQDRYISCAEEAATKFMAKDARFVPGIYFKTRRKIPEKDLVVDCNCLPGCSSLDYEADVTQIAWNWRTALVDKDCCFFHLKKLKIFYKDNKFITLERNELYGQTDFIASCGGLLGLFVGFSLMSAVEIVYYITLRLFCNFYKFGKSRWSGAQSEQQIKLS